MKLYLQATLMAAISIGLCFGVAAISGVSSYKLIGAVALFQAWYATVRQR